MTGELEAFLRLGGVAGRPAFMPYVTAGHPSAGSMRGIFSMLRDAGADCLELGVPFSDPVADGVVIQESTQAALRGGMTPESALHAAEAAAHAGLRVLLMGYANPFLQAGLDRFATRAASAGVAGLVVPDLPLEESRSWSAVLARCGLDLPLFAAPTTPEARLRKISRMATGFIYYVSVAGVTGERGRVPHGLLDRLAWMRTRLGKPVCVGFGVSSPAQASILGRVSSGVIVGSALVRRLAEWRESPGKRREIARWTRAMARSTHGG